MSKLYLYANLWTMVGHPRPGREWSLERKLSAIAEAGFDGVTGALDEPTVARAGGLGLECVGWFWATDTATIDRELARHARLGVRRLTVFLGQHDTPVADALALALHLRRGARETGLHVAPETHRDTATETPEKFATLLAKYRQRCGEEMPATWDFSHHALVKHLARADWTKRLLTEPAAIASARLFHFRPFNGQHAQIPVRVAGRRTPEFVEFMDFVGEVLRGWRAAPGNAGAELWACPEVGPKVAGYGLSHDPAPWEQAVTLARDLRAAWRGAA